MYTRRTNDVPTISVRVTSAAPNIAAAAPGSPIPHPSSSTPFPRTSCTPEEIRRGGREQGSTKKKILTTVFFKEPGRDVQGGGEGGGEGGEVTETKQKKKVGKTTHFLDSRTKSQRELLSFFYFFFLFRLVLTIYGKEQYGSVFSSWRAPLGGGGEGVRVKPSSSLATEGVKKIPKKFVGSSHEELAEHFSSSPKTCLPIHSFVLIARTERRVSYSAMSSPTITILVNLSYASRHSSTPERSSPRSETFVFPENAQPLPPPDDSHILHTFPLLLPYTPKLIYGQQHLFLRFPPTVAGRSTLSRLRYPTTGGGSVLDIHAWP